MPPKHVPKHRAPKRELFKLPGLPNGSQNGKASPGARGRDFGRRRKAEEVEVPPHSSHVRRREAPEVLDDPLEAKAAARTTQLPEAAPADPPAASPAEPLRPPVKTASDDSAHQAARHETGSTLVDDPDVIRVKSAIRGGGEAWDPFLKDPEPETRRFRRNGAVTDLDRVKTRKRVRKPRPPATTHERQQHQTLGQWFKEIVILGIIAILTAVLLTNYVVQAFFIPSVSMENTLKVNDRVLVNKLVYNFRDPKPGELVVFVSPDRSEADVPDAGPLGNAMNDVAQGLGLRSSVQDLIKRVIAVEGQTVEVKIGSVFVDGKQLNEPYRKDILPIPDYPAFTVPEGTVFVMGDNRNQSHDSRAFGPVDVDTIVGKAFALIWPVSRFRWFNP
ncbi:MAG TPA: signal peptidase I [Actinomycetota bacterium]|nr:signal peptidase I [Actinomycetota bacterium]